MSFAHEPPDTTPPPPPAAGGCGAGADCAVATEPTAAGGDGVDCGDWLGIDCGG